MDMSYFCAHSFLSCRLSYPGLVYNLWPGRHYWHCGRQRGSHCTVPSPGQITKVCRLRTRPGLSLGSSLSPLF